MWLLGFMNWNPSLLVVVASYPSCFFLLWNSRFDQAELPSCVSNVSLSYHSWYHVILDSKLVIYYFKSMKMTDVDLFYFKKTRKILPKSKMFILFTEPLGTLIKWSYGYSITRSIILASSVLLKLPTRYSFEEKMNEWGIITLKKYCWLYFVCKRVMAL